MKDTIALVVAIENYRFSERHGIEKVDYAINDSVEFKKILLERFNLQENNITYWVDEKATKSALENEIPYLIRNLKRDERFIFYYAEHGFFYSGENRLSAWDTHPTNLTETTISLTDVLPQPLNKSECEPEMEPPYEGEETPAESGMKTVILSFQVPKGKVAGIMRVMNLLQSKFEILELEIKASKGFMTDQEY